MLAGLAGAQDIILMDADSHASIYDGCRLSGAKVIRFRHNDPEDLDRRLTRLSNGFSKKPENLTAAVALHFCHYNFVRRHSSIKTTPAVAAGVADRPLSLLDFVEWGSCIR